MTLIHTTLPKPIFQKIPPGVSHERECGMAKHDLSNLLQGLYTHYNLSPVEMVEILEQDHWLRRVREIALGEVRL